MKRFYTLIVSIVLILSSVAMNAQQKPDIAYLKARKAFVDAQLVEIKEKLGLDEIRGKKFEFIYRRYAMEYDNNRRALRPPKNPADSLSDAVAELIILEQIADGRKFLEIREKYYYEFKKILTPREIYRVFKIEQETHRKLMQEYKKRKE